MNGLWIFTVFVILSSMNILLTAAPLGRYYGFGSMEILKLDWGLGRPVVVDVNGDQRNDIVVVNNRKARIDILLQKAHFDPNTIYFPEPDAEDINDVFGKETNWRFQRESYSLDYAATSLLVLDYNQDGLPDLVYYTEKGLFIVLQDQPQAVGDGEMRLPQWLSPIKIDVTDGAKAPRALTDGDLNGDGRRDLALLADDGVYVILQTDEPMPKPVKYPSEANRLRGLRVADVDGDQRDDLILITADTDYPVLICFQQNDGTLGPQRRYRLPVPSAVELSPLGNSGKSQFLSVSGRNGRVVISTLSQPEDEQELPVLTYPLPETTSGKNRDILSADLDGDGILDVVATDPGRAEFLLYRGNKTTGLSGPERFPGFQDMQKVAAGVLDDSGKASLVVLSLEEKLIGISRLESERISYPKILDIAGEPQAMDLADINGDDRPDLVYVARERVGRSNRFFLRSLLSVGHDEQAAGTELELEDMDDRPQGLLVGDIDHDGRADVMILSSFGPVRLIRQPQADQWEVVPPDKDVHAGLMSRISPSAISLVPIGPAGQTIALLAQKNFARSLFFDPEKGWQVIDQYQAEHPDSSLSVVQAGYLLDESRFNILAYDSVRGRVIILGEGEDGTYRTEREVEVGSLDARCMSLGYFGGEHSHQLLLAGTDQFAIIPMQSQARRLREVAGFEPDVEEVRYGAVAVGDVNHDQFPDIVLCDQKGNRIEILAFDENAQLVRATQFKVFDTPRGADEDDSGPSAEPRMVVLGDVTGDGWTDLIVPVHDRIVIYPQDG